MSASRSRVLWLSPGSLPLGLLQAWARAAGATLREWPAGSAEGDESPADGPADWWLRVLPDTPPDAERPVFEALTADVHHTHLLLHWRQPMWRLLAQAQAAGPQDLSGQPSLLEGRNGQVRPAFSATDACAAESTSGSPR